MPHTYEYPRPQVAADVILLRQTRNAALEVLLIERRNEPFRGLWALPGGFVDIDEDLPDAARRELGEETGVRLPDDARLVQFGTYGKPGRDPRGRTISVVYLAGVSPEGSAPVAGDDAARAAWFPLSGLPELAFDHADILADAARRIGTEPGLVSGD
jgi:8-oxo-dGTP diphosphatase